MPVHFSTIMYLPANLLLMSLSELLPVVFIVLAIIGAGIQISRERPKAGNAKMTKIFLNWAFLVIIGIGGVWGCFGHLFFADRVAQSIGWPAGNPFQQEVAFANLAIGMLGLLALRIPGTFRIATLTAYAVFMIGDGIVHIWQIVSAGNWSVNNAGLILWIDLIMPLVLIGLYLLGEKLQMREAQPSLRR
ncbi:MAG: hypothetical protein LUQ50_01105 [Methanospirillum sp.]|uniref:DUF6790 family protein n=1 Tax=Methanospirillum sp. TaxID=45200 RepID=UPI0023698A06|nr:DUF6790 family protein [Methanospirillum sp.]MDD1727650.1 hypothetical protein [Methanospirillum sp.]